jgi:sugar O-acyltransferase (sialic acid O-acetyltransferase NeuD family)
MQKVIMIGANNPEVIRLIRDWENDDRKVIGFIDNDKSLWGKMFYGYPIFSGFEVLPKLVEDHWFVNLITGNVSKRAQATGAVLRSGGRFANFIHPGVNQDMVDFGEGIYIQDHVILQAEVAIDDHVAIHTGAIIAHECVIGRHSFIAHGACLSGKVEVGEGVFIGANATILPRLKIGKWSVVADGAMVTKDVPDYMTVVGNPARELVK